MRKANSNISKNSGSSKGSWTLEALGLFSRGKTAVNKVFQKTDRGSCGPAPELDLHAGKAAWASGEAPSAYPAALKLAQAQQGEQWQPPRAPSSPPASSGQAYQAHQGEQWPPPKAPSSPVKSFTVSSKGLPISEEVQRDDSDSDDSSDESVVFSSRAALRSRSVHVIHSWEGHGLITVPKDSKAVCIMTRVPSNTDALDLVEEIVSRRMSMPIIVILVPPAKLGRIEPQSLQQETKKFLELGASDVVLEPDSQDPRDLEACVDMWLGLASLRAHQRRKLESWEDELRAVVETASAREDGLFWEQVHHLCPGIAKLNPELQEPALDGMFGCHHRVVEQINAGAFSDLYVVSDEKKQVRAMKAVKKEKLVSFNLVQGVSNEVQILRRLRHDNVVRFHGSAHSREHLIVLQELVGRTNLFNVLEGLERDGASPLRLSQAQGFFQQMAAALAYCHHEGISHRDVKPESFAVSDALSVVKLVDFGLAAELKAPLKYKGTMPYVAPEVIEQDRRGYNAAAADMWSLGVVLVETVCGLNAFARMLKWRDVSAPEPAHAEDLRGALGTPNWLRAGVKERIRPNIPLCADLDELIHGMLGAEIATRWTAAVVLQSGWLRSAEEC